MSQDVGGRKPVDPVAGCPLPESIVTIPTLQASQLESLHRDNSFYSSTLLSCSRRPTRKKVRCYFLAIFLLCGFINNSFAAPPLSKEVAKTPPDESPTENEPPENKGKNDDIAPITGNSYNPQPSTKTENSAHPDSNKTENKNQLDPSSESLQHQNQPENGPLKTDPSNSEISIAAEAQENQTPTIEAQIEPSAVNQETNEDLLLTKVQDIPAPTTAANDQSIGNRQEPGGAGAAASVPENPKTTKLTATNLPAAVQQADEAILVADNPDNPPPSAPAEDEPAGNGQQTDEALLITDYPENPAPSAPAEDEPAGNGQQSDEVILVADNPENPTPSVPPGNEPAGNGQQTDETLLVTNNPDNPALSSPAENAPAGNGQQSDETTLVSSNPESQVPSVPVENAPAENGQQSNEESLVTDLPETPLPAPAETARSDPKPPTETITPGPDNKPPVQPEATSTDLEETSSSAPSVADKTTPAFNELSGTELSDSGNTNDNNSSAADEGAATNPDVNLDPPPESTPDEITSGATAAIESDTQSTMATGNTLVAGENESVFDSQTVIEPAPTLQSNPQSPTIPFSPTNLAKALLAGCLPIGTPRDDNIVCNGTHPLEVDAGRGDDQVTVNNTASVVVQGTVLEPDVVVIDGGRGDDEIVNNGAVSGHSETFLVERAPSVTGIAGSGGTDSIANTGTINVTTMSTTTGITGGLGWLKRLISGSTLSTRAAGIDGGNGDDNLLNSGLINVSASATRSEIGLGSILQSPVPPNNSSSSPVSIATGLLGGSGQDQIENRGTITVFAEANENSIEIDLFANGAAGSSSSSTVSASAIGIDAGEDNDMVINLGVIEVFTQSATEGTSVSVAPSGNASILNSFFVGGATTSSTSTGISTGGGNDSAINDGNILANALAEASATTVAVAVSNVASAAAKATANATAVGIDAGNGDDSVVNNGTILASSDASVDALDIAVSIEGDAKASHDGSTKAVAKSVGINGDGAAQQVPPSPDFQEKLLPTQLTQTLRTETAVSAGNDTIENNGSLSAEAVSTSGLASIAASIDGVASSKVDSKSESTAISINAGAGDDAVSNTSAISASSTATSSANAIAFSADGNAVLSGGPKASSTTVGISGDGTEGNKLIEETLVITSDQVETRVTEEETAASGIDTIANDGTIEVAAIADATSIGVTLSISGAASADTSATAKATATAIDAGSDDDTVSNDGELLINSTATADAVAVGFSNSQKSELKAGATADANAIGISGDGQKLNDFFEYLRTISTEGINISITNAKTVDAGADTVLNEAKITTIAEGTSRSAGVSLSIEGASSAAVNPTVKSLSTAIDTGGAGDVVANSGNLTAESSAVSAGVGVAFSLADKAVVETNPVAEALATGISSDGNTTDKLTQFSLGIGQDGLNVNYSDMATAVEGSDSLTNSGDISAVASATAGSIGVAVSISGAASANAKSTAKTTAAAIDAGGADDDLSNSGTLTVESTSLSGGIGVSFSSSGESKAETGQEAIATATGISSDGFKSDELFNWSFTIGPDGLVATLQKAESAATGSDTISNTGEIFSQARATSGTAGVAVSIEGASSAEIKPKATATATAIDAGGADDSVSNTGQLTTGSTAISAGIGVGFSSSGEAKTETGPEATAIATGISGDGTARDSLVQGSLQVDGSGLASTLLFEETAATGSDAITNTGELTSQARAISGSLGAAVSISGASSAETNSTSTAVASGIDAGGADDNVANSGILTAESQAIAGALGVGFSQSDKAEVKAGVTANANATGISGDGTLLDTSVQGSLQIDSSGLNSAFQLHETAAGGNDTLANSGDISALANAVSSSIGIAVSIGSGSGSGSGTDTGTETASGLDAEPGEAEDDPEPEPEISAADIKGGASSDTNSTAVANVTAIDAGAGDDSVSNEGELTAAATATALTLAGGISQAEAGSATAEAKSEANATGISGDGTLKNRTVEGSLSVSSNQIAVSALFEKKGSTGADQISNDGVVNATATARSGSGAVGVSVDGAASAKAESTAKSAADAIIAGNGDDTVNNTGALTAAAMSTAAEFSASVSGKGSAKNLKSIWQGGSNATATASALSGDSRGSGVTVEGLLVIDLANQQVNTNNTTSILQAGGNDTLINSGNATVSSVALTPSVDVAVALEGMAISLTTSESTSNATAIDGGAGDDDIQNHGELGLLSLASTATLNVDVATKGSALAASSIWNGGTTAEAAATGISADGDGKNWFIENAIDATLDKVSISRNVSRNAASGNDDIFNDGNLNAIAISAVPTLSAVVSVTDTAASFSTSTSESRATGIDAGTGNDTVNNEGKLTTDSVAGAIAANVAVAKDFSLTTNDFWDGGILADAKSTGISGDGDGKDLTFSSLVEVARDDETTPENEGLIRTARTFSSIAASGDDDLTNSGAIDARAVATSSSIGVSVTISKGVAVGISTATAKARTAGIDAGGGNDTVENFGEDEITANATANANAVSVAYTSGGAAIANGNTTADADAVGIDGDGEASDLVVESSVEATPSQASLTNSLSKTAVTGDDSITNSSIIRATSRAVAPSVSVSISPTLGVSVATTSATADARSAAIDAGSGNDTVDNSAEIDADAVAVGAAVSVDYVSGGLGIAKADVKAQAEAVGLSGDGNSEDLVIDNEITVTFDDESSPEDESTIRLANNLSKQSVSGNDVITNTGAIDSLSVATSTAVGVSVTVSGGAAVGITNSSANARAAGIDAGGGDDSITNLEADPVIANAVANANAVSVAYTTLGVPIADAGTTAEAEAIGIDGDGTGSDLAIENLLELTADTALLTSTLSSTAASGDDTIINDSVIEATSVAAAPSIGVAVSPGVGVSVAVTSAEATSRAAAIDAGPGADEVDNSGNIKADAGAISAAVSFDYVTGGLGLAKSDVLAQSQSIGISGDGRSNDVIVSNAIEVIEDDESSPGNDASYEISSTTTNTAVGGNDLIENSGSIESRSGASTTSVGVSVTISGGGAAGVTNSTAEAGSTGIEAGAGNDVVNASDTSSITTDAIANANAVSVAYSSIGVAIADTSTNATAEAIGIDGDGNDSDQLIENSIQITDDLVSVASSRSTTEISGDDTISNDGVINASSLAVSPSVGVAVTPGGLSVANTAVSTASRTAAIDAGAGDDTVENAGNLDASAKSVSVAIPVAVTPAGVAIATDSIWDGGTQAEADATGISGDGRGANSLSEFAIEASEEAVSLRTYDATTAVSGNDNIINRGELDVSALSESNSIAVSITPAGLAVATSASTATSRTAAIDAGAGDDTIENDSSLTSSSVANANALSVAVAGGGLSVASGPVFDGGTTADAEAVGITADGEGSDDEAEENVDVDESGISLTVSESSSAVSGDDEVINSGLITTTAVAVAPSIGVAVTPAGVSVASSTATARSRAIAINTGSGNDVIDNSGVLDVLSVANADAISVAVSPAGVAIASDAVWDGGTNATAEAIGISGDGTGQNAASEFSILANNEVLTLGLSNANELANGNDTITNASEITATATAVVPSINVAVTPAGLSVALSTASTSAQAMAIDAGAGDDDIDNSGFLKANSNSVSVAIPVAVAPAGVAIVADAIWDGGTNASAESAGISADGSGGSTNSDSSVSVDSSGIRTATRKTTEAAVGDDTVVNDGEIAATAVGVATSVGVSVTPIGVSISASTATTDGSASAIDLGAGNDTVDNAGKLTALSDSIAVAVPIAVAPVGFAVAADALWDGGTNATAAAVGISGDGQGINSVSESITESVEAGTLIRKSNEVSRVSGNDIINNSGEVDATAVSVAPAVAFSLGVVGGVSLTNATADTAAQAINAGGGDDLVTNSGDLSARSVSTPVSVGVSLGALALSGNAILDGGTTANADATGISGDGNEGDESSEFVMTSDGSTRAITRTESFESASGNDVIASQGTITADARAVSPAVSVSIGALGVAASTSTATARAVGIDAGAGDDKVTNCDLLNTETLCTRDSTLNVEADADAIGVNIALGVFSVAGNSVWDGGTTANARAIGISGDGNANRSTTNRGIETSGLSGLVHENTTYTSMFGNDEIVNAGAINTLAHANSVSASISNVVGIIPNAIGAAVSTSTSNSSATGIEAGGGSDSVRNEGHLTVDSVARATTVNVSFILGLGGAITNDSLDGGTTAEAEAIGIDGNGQTGNETEDFTVQISEDGTTFSNDTTTTVNDGNDDINNTGTIDTTAYANSTSVGVAIPVIGASAAISTSTAKTFASAIRADDGDDTVFNQGMLTSASIADADGVSVALTTIGAAVASDSFWNGGTTAEAIANGIDGGTGNDTITNASLVSAISDANTTSTSVSISGGVAAAFSAATGYARSTAIAGDDGDDAITNNSFLFADSSATARGTSVSLSTLGITAADTSVSAEASASGADSGDGTDVVVNVGEIDANATATAKSGEVTIAPVSIGIDNPLFEGQTNATSFAAGLLSSDGNDVLVNGSDSLILLDSKAEIEASSVTVGLLGFSKASNAANASARSTGLGGGDGNDQLINHGLIEALVISDVKARSINVTLAGAGIADVSTYSNASALGLGGGAGNDELHNTGAISLASQADANAKSVAVTLAGAGNAEAQTNTVASTTGAAGGAGADDVFNVGSIDINATSTARSVGTSVGIFGVSTQSAKTSATAFAAGLDGGADDDVLANHDFLSVRATANAVVDNASWDLVGVAAQKGIVEAQATAVGIIGAEGIDTILNDEAGELRVAAESTLTLTGNANVLVGNSDADATIKNALFSTGIASGPDDDLIVNSGEVDVSLHSNVNSSSSSISITGTAGTSAGMLSLSVGHGIVGDSGNDLIFNDGLLTIGLHFDGSLETSSWTLAGGASDIGNYSSDQVATGLAGGDDDDRLENGGELRVEVTNDLNILGGSNAIFGITTGDSSLTSSARGVGLDGGAGRNELINLGILELDVVTGFTANSVAFSFAGGSSSSAALKTAATAIGLQGEADEDLILVAGTLAVRSEAGINSTTASRTKFGVAGTDSSIALTADASAAAVMAGAGSAADIVAVAGDVEVVANALPSAISTADASGLLLIDGIAKSDTRSFLEALGADLGAGDNSLRNEGNIDITTLGGGFSKSLAETFGGIEANASAQADAEVISSIARGITADVGNNRIENFGLLSVSNNAGPRAVANSDGTGLRDGNSNATSGAVAKSVYTAGIDLSDGQNIVINGIAGGIFVATGVQSSATSTAKASGLGVFEASTGRANSRAQTNSASAYGIRAGNEDNQIVNLGELSVLSAPRAIAQATSKVSDPALAFAIDAYADATSSANNSQAFGIATEDGSNTIHNAGTLIVRSEPVADATAIARGYGWEGDAFADTVATANNALAVGISGGNGGNLIVNDGFLEVVANPTATTTTIADPGEITLTLGGGTREVCWWEPIIPPPLRRPFFKKKCKTITLPSTTVTKTGDSAKTSLERKLNAAAFGIRTEDGNDLVINQGLIRTEVYGIEGAGTAISTGAGDDEVRFGDGSTVLGHIDLGDGDDLLTLRSASSVSGLTDANLGNDTIISYGAGSFSGMLKNFEEIYKREPGIFALSSQVPTMNAIGITGGTLYLAGDYSMGVDSAFSTFVNSDGTHGKLQVENQLNLDGLINVGKDSGLFTDGATYDVAIADLITGSFNAINLPDPTATLSFSLQQSPTEVEVVANVEPLASFALDGDSMAQSIGSYLDGLAGTSNEEIGNLLLTLQQTENPDVIAETISTLSPSNRDNIKTSAMISVKRSISAIQERLADIRAASTTDTAFLAGNLPVTFARAVGQQTGKVGTPWVAGYNYSGNKPGVGTDTFAANNFVFSSGIDFAFDNGVILGASIANSYNALGQNRQADFHEMETLIGSLYGTHFSESGFYTQGVISAGPSQIRNSRSLQNASSSNFIEGEHDGSVFEVNFETGYSFDSKPLQTELFSAISFVRINEEAYEESGGGSFGYAIDETSLSSLTAELGVRAAYTIKNRWGVWRPRGSVAMVHEFNLNKDYYSGSLIGSRANRFNIETGHADIGGYRLSLGIESPRQQNLLFSLKWDHRKLGRYSDSALIAELEWRF